MSARVLDSSTTFADDAADRPRGQVEFGCAVALEIALGQLALQASDLLGGLLKAVLHVGALALDTRDRVSKRRGGSLGLAAGLYE